MFFLYLVFLFVVDEDNGQENLFLCAYSFSDSAFAACDTLSPFTLVLLRKQLLFLCDLVIILMSCNKDFCT